MISSTVSARRVSSILLLLAMATAFVFTAGTPAQAHESREVGPYTFVVGWVNEPAYSGLPNAVDLRISDTESEDPVEDVADAFTVDIMYGDETITADFRDQFGEPGAYRSDIVPSRPGTWSFRIYGTLDGTDIDETFTSGPETFSDMADIALESWPVQDPSTAELSERLERELARIDERIVVVETATNAVDVEAGTDTTAAMGGDSDGMAEDPEAMADLDARVAALEEGDGDDSGGSSTWVLVLAGISLVIAIVALVISLRSRPT